MSVNWIDFVIIAVAVFQIYEGWNRGFTTLIANLGSFLASLWLAVRYHKAVGDFFVMKFGLSASWTNVLGYIAVALISQVVLEELFIYAINKLPDKFKQSKINHGLGSVVSLLNALIMTSFFLLLVLSLPLRGSIKTDIRNSRIGSLLVIVSEKYGGKVKSSLEEVARETVKFLTVKPGSRETIPIELPAGQVSFSVDAETEAQMITLINGERKSRNLPELRLDYSITEVARGKSRDMFERRYFSHYDPDGKNAADRMEESGVPFTLVGENLAYAPDLKSAHDGLMGSEGHRANILEPRFRRIGIGVIDGGIYGKMFTQVFAD